MMAPSSSPPTWPACHSSAVRPIGKGDASPDLVASPLGVSNRVLMTAHVDSPTGRRLLTVDEVADRLNCSPWTVRRLVRRGLLDVVVIGGLHRFRPRDIDQIEQDGAPINNERPASPPSARPKRAAPRHASG